jgi:cytochrome b subunit of formate dehydrogenase
MTGNTGNPVATRYYFRFSLAQRLLHGLLITSFLGLAITGMPLHFNQSGWAFWLAHTLGGFGVMGFFHRTFAVFMMSCFLIHLSTLAYRIFVCRELEILWGPDSLVPQPKDITEMVEHIRFFFGLGPRPRFGRFTYWEKFDYFAVFWGMAIIGGSGLVLWFHAFFSRFLPGWIFNITNLVHGEEALLAVGFIFTIHFFNSHLRPEKFPMDLVIFTGRVSEDELREERPDEYERLVAEGRLASIETDPPPLWLRNFGRIVGALAVSIGLVGFAHILLAVLGR